MSSFIFSIPFCMDVGVGAHGRIRTYNTLLRRQILYPVELRRLLIKEKG
jgi:hypothetical protein